MLLSLLHLLDKRLGLLFVREGESGGAIFELECVEEGAVLVVREIVIDLLVPDHALSRGLQRG